MDPQDPHKIIGYEIPQADGTDYGCRVLGYAALTEDYNVQPIRWSTGEAIGNVLDIDVLNIFYQYNMQLARLPS